jgi:[ribosomal protein S18]-alanine N-acetyltransferase
MPSENAAASYAISPLVQGDLPAIKQLESAGQVFPWSDALLIEELSCDHACHFGARIGRDPPLRAFILCRLFCNELAIHNLCTDPRMRRRGLATALVRHAIAHARSLGAKAAFLEVRSSNNAATALYSREGFAALDIRRKYYSNGDDALVMTRLL